MAQTLYHWQIIWIIQYIKRLSRAYQYIYIYIYIYIEYCDIKSDERIYLDLRASSGYVKRSWKTWTKRLKNYSPFSTKTGRYKNVKSESLGDIP